LKPVYPVTLPFDENGVT